MPSKRIVGDLAQTSVGATGSETQVLGLMEWSIDRKSKAVDSTTTDDAGDETYLPSTRSWTATAKYAYLEGDTSQRTNILDAISSAQTAVQWNFFLDAAATDDAFTGKAFVDSYKVAGGVGKVFAVDITLRGTGPLTRTAQAAPASGQAEV